MRLWSIWQIKSVQMKPKSFVSNVLSQELRCSPTRLQSPVIRRNVLGEMASNLWPSRDVPTRQTRKRFRTQSSGTRSSSRSSCDCGVSDESPVRKRGKVPGDSTKLKSLRALNRSQFTAPENDSAHSSCSESSILGVNQTLSSENQHAGVIERICLKNFMCHSLLEFHLDPHVNFIIGRNGSGKSAVLAAVMVGLGGKAHITNRGKHLGSLVQNGKASARVEITLANRGSLAFKPDEFGPSISIIRTLRINSSGMYEIRSHERKLISTKREDLSAILTHFNIQVDNPVVVLNQETARNFLQTKSTKAKYEFFMKATQLEKIRDNYHQAKALSLDSTDNLLAKKEMLNDIAEQRKKHEAILNIYKSLAHQRERVAELEAELAWNAVLKHESLVSASSIEVQKIESQLASLEEEISTSQDVARLVEDRIIAARQLVDNETAVKEEHQACANTARLAVNEMKKALCAVEDERQKVKREIHDLEGDRQAYLNEISRPQHKDSEWQKEKERRQAEIVSLSEKISKLSSDEQKAAEAERNARAELTEASSRAQNKRSILTHLRTDLDNVNLQIRTAKAARSDAINRFGANVDSVLKEITAETRFRVKPKGPIGAFIDMQDRYWAYAVERLCSSSLTGWLVDNNDDYKLLKEILSRHNLNRVPVFMRKLNCRRRYNCPIVGVNSAVNMNSSNIGGTVNRSRCVTCVVTFLDDDVYNMLVDEHRINEVLLYDNVENALSDMKRPATVPRGCFVALDVNFSRIFPAPKYRYFANDRPIQVRYLVSAVQAKQQLTDLLNQEMQLKTKIKIATDEVQIQEQAVTAAEARVREARLLVSAVSKKLLENQRALRGLHDFEEPMPINLGPLQEEISRLDALIAEKKENVSAEVEKRHKQAMERMRCGIDKFKKCEASLSASNQKLEKLRRDLAKVEDDIRQHEQANEHLKARKSGLHVALKDLKRDLKSRQQELDALTDTTKKSFPNRVESRPSAATIRTELKTLQAQIAQTESTHTDYEATLQSYEQSVRLHDRLCGEINKLESYISDLVVLCEKRCQLYEAIREMTFFTVNTIFNALMLYEGFHAELLLDHDTNTLEIHVPAGDSSENARDVRGFSGGERSYSTVCFICALWAQTATTPFRVLDEFDIFMDMSKRRRSLQMLLEVCEQQASCQFIFLTPLEMPNLEALKVAKIQKMPEPKRSATVQEDGQVVD